MTKDKRFLANQLNAQKSSGPRTAEGLAISSKNALQHGLYSNSLVVGTGESPEEFEQFRAAVHAELNPRGAILSRLADRIALLMWRLDRVTRYEAAVVQIAISSGKLPVDPSTITGAGVDPFTEVPKDAPPAQRLAYLRHRMGGWAAEVEACRRLIPVFAGEGDETKLVVPHTSLAFATMAVFAWEWESGRERWRVLWTTGEVKFGEKPTAAQLRGLFQKLAQEAGRDPAAVLLAIRDELLWQISKDEVTLREAHAEEQRLAAKLKEARERAVAATLYADDAASERVIRMEGHLARQLDAALTLFERLQEKAAAEPRVSLLVAELKPRVPELDVGAISGAEVGSLRGGAFTERDREVIIENESPPEAVCSNSSA